MTAGMIDGVTDFSPGLMPVVPLFTECKAEAYLPPLPRPVWHQCPQCTLFLGLLCVCECGLYATDLLNFSVWGDFLVSFLILGKATWQRPNPTKSHPGGLCSHSGHFPVTDGKFAGPRSPQNASSVDICVSSFPLRCFSLQLRG